MESILMKTVYLILTHTNFDQLSAIVDTLNYKDTTFFIHVDAKSNINSIPKDLMKMKNVFWVKDRERVCWGGFSQVAATLKLLQMAYEHHRKDEKAYFHLISGADFPIKSNSYMSDYLNNNYGVQYIEYNKLPYKGWAHNGGLDRLKYYWFMDDMNQDDGYKMYLVQKELKMTNRNYAEGLYYGGSQWWSITIDCVKYILKKVKDGRLIHQYRQTYCPDEIFFHTLIKTTNKFKIVNNNLRYIDWISGPEYPKLLDISDREKIKASAGFYARKIDMQKSPDLIAFLK